jgi:thioredoxin-like negative regulator of GroEL
MKPIFLKVSEKLRNENSEVQLYTINAEKNRDITVNYGVRSVPTIKSFNGGEEVESRTGILQEQQLNEMATTLLNG